MLVWSGCGDKEQAAGNAPAAAAAPSEAQPPPKEEAPPPPKEKSELEKLTEPLATAKGSDAATALTGLRGYIDANPSAVDAGDAAKLLVKTAFDRAIESTTSEESAALLKSLQGDGDALAPAVLSQLASGKEDAAAVLAALLDQTLDALEAVQSVAAKKFSVYGPHAVAVVAARLKKEAARFQSEGSLQSRVADAIPSDGQWWRCEAARADGKKAGVDCPPEFYGVASKDTLTTLSDDALKLLRLNQVLVAAKESRLGTWPLPVGTDGRATSPGTRGTTSVALPLEWVQVGPDGVRFGTRPVVSMESGDLLAGTASKTVAWAAGDKEKEGFRAALVAEATALQASTAQANVGALGEDANSPNHGLEKGHWSCVVDVLSDTTAGQLANAAAALNEAGYSDIRYRRAADEFSVLAAPNRADRIPAARQGRPEKRSLLVHVLADRVDLFSPKGGEGEAAKEAQAVALPGAAKRWYKGTRVFKTSVGGDGTDAIVQTVRAIRHAESAGAVVLVAASPNVKAERVLRIAADISTAVGPAAQAKLSEVFPGLVCGDESKAHTSEGCQTLFPILFPDVKIPRASGLTDKPEKKVAKVKEPPKPKPEPKPQPKAGFCDKRDLARALGSRKGAIKFCYNRRLQMNSELKGKVVVRIVVGANGKVKSATSSGSMPDKKVHACVLKEIRKLKFKAPDGGECVVRKPFTFKP